MPKCYNVIGQIYNASQEVTPDAKCNGWTAINKGTATAFVNGIPLKPPPSATTSGEAISIGGNADEIFTGKIAIKIDATDTAPMIVLIQKFYIN